MSAAEDDETVSRSGIWREDLLLHFRKPIPAVHQGLSPPSRGGEVKHAIPSDGVVDGGDDRQPSAGES